MPQTTEKKATEKKARKEPKLFLQEGQEVWAEDLLIVQADKHPAEPVSSSTVFPTGVNRPEVWSSARVSVLKMYYSSGTELIGHIQIQILLT